MRGTETGARYPSSSQVCPPWMWWGGVNRELSEICCYWKLSFPSSNSLLRKLESSTDIITLLVRDGSCRRLSPALAGTPKPSAAPCVIMARYWHLWWQLQELTSTWRCWSKSKKNCSPRHLPCQWPTNLHSHNKRSSVFQALSLPQACASLWIRAPLGQKFSKSQVPSFQSQLVVSLFPPSGQLSYELLPKATVKLNHCALGGWVVGEEEILTSQGNCLCCTSCWPWACSPMHRSCGGFLLSLFSRPGARDQVCCSISCTWAFIANANPQECVKLKPWGFAQHAVL